MCLLFIGSPFHEKSSHVAVAQRPILKDVRSMLKILEISYAEEQEKAITQLEMNLTAAEMYHLWDNTLNIIGGLLETKLTWKFCGKRVVCVKGRLISYCPFQSVFYSNSDCEITLATCLFF